MLYVAGFDVSKIDRTLGTLGTLTVSTAGKPDLVLNLADVRGLTRLSASSAKFWHWSYQVLAGLYIRAKDTPSVVYRRDDFSWKSWENALSEALAALATSAGWTSPGTLQFSMSLSTGLVTASYTTTFALTWSTALGRQLCGFDNDKSGAASYAGTVVPLFVIEPGLRRISGAARTTFAAGRASSVRADNGGGFSIKRGTVALRRKWVQQFIPLEKVEHDAALSTHPWTMQDLIEHCPGGYPFIVHDGGFGITADEAFSFTTEGSDFDHKATGTDGVYIAKQHTEFDCYVEGRITDS